MYKLSKRLLQGMTQLSTALLVCGLVLPSQATMVHAQDEAEPMPQPIPERILCVTQEGGSYDECDAVFTYIQDAIDVATPFIDEIRVAGGDYTFNDANIDQPQVVHIRKSTTLSGGYSESNWNMPYPNENPTIIDANGNGRGIFIDGSSKPIAVTIKGFEIISGNAPLNDAESSRGGGIRIVRAEARLLNNKVTDNHAERGGGIDATLSVVKMTNNLVAHNAASSSSIAAGGGLFLESSGLWLEHTRIHGNYVKGEKAAAGAGIAADQCLVLGKGQNEIQYNELRDSSIAIGGGAFFANCDLYLDGTVVTGNSITSANASHGAGLFLYSHSTIPGPTILSNNTISDNWIDSTGGTATGAGLHIANAGTLEDAIYLIDSKVENNGIWTQDTFLDDGSNTPTDSRGAGIYMEESLVGLKGNNIEFNQLNGYDSVYSIGGGVYMDHAAAYLEANRFTYNQTYSERSIAGGSGLASLFSAVAMKNNLISDNWTEGPILDGGAGMYALDSVLLAENTVVQRNSGGDIGSGIMLDGYPTLSMDFIHTTVRQNSTHYGEPDNAEFQPSGIGLWEGTANFTNSIIADEANGVHVHNDSTVNLAATLWHYNQADATGDGTIVMHKSYLGDPKFRDYCYEYPDYDWRFDFEICPDSAAVGRGIITHVTADFKGQPRDGKPDLGADELDLAFPQPIDPVDPTDPVGPIVPQPIAPDEIAGPSPLDVPAPLPPAEQDWSFNDVDSSIEALALPPVEYAVELPTLSTIPPLPEQPQVVGNDSVFAGNDNGMSETVALFIASQEPPILDISDDALLPDSNQPGESNEPGESEPVADNDVASDLGNDLGNDLGGDLDNDVDAEAPTGDSATNTDASQPDSESNGTQENTPDGANETGENSDSAASGINRNEESSNPSVSSGSQDNTVFLPYLNIGTR